MKILPGRLLTFILSAAFTLSAVACTHQPEATDYHPDCPGLTPTPTADQTAGRRGEPYETTTHAFVVVGNAGIWQDDPEFSRGESPKWKATVAIGPWVQGSDQAGLANAWLGVSGTGSMPLLSGPYVETGMITARMGQPDVTRVGKFYACLDSRRAAYIFGTVTFEDVTEFSRPLPEGYERPNYPTYHEIQNVSLELVPGLGREAIPEFFACYEQRCGQSENGRESEELKLPIIYSYSDDDEEGGPGPRPFVIAVPDAFPSPSETSEALVAGSVLRLVKGTSPVEQDGEQGLFGVDIPTSLGW